MMVNKMHLNVSWAHVMFMSLQRQVPVFFTLKPNECLTIPSALSIQA